MPGIKITPYFFLLLYSLISCKKEVAIVYPQPVPSGEFVKFLPGLISNDSTFEFNSLYGPDGKSFYFSRNEIYDIYVTTYDGSNWSEPMITPFSEKEYKECDPAFSPDGSKLYYISTRKRNAADTTDDFDIWYVERQGEEWSTPKNLEIVNSDSSEFYVSFAKNGNLYFASNRAGGLGSFDIYVSRYTNGEYTMPINLGDSINDEHFEHDPFISSDERLLIFTSVNRVEGIGRGDLYYSVKGNNDAWSKARNLGATINGPDYDFCPYITTDGKYFFYSDNNNIKWIDAEQLWKIVGLNEIP